MAGRTNRRSDLSRHRSTQSWGDRWRSKSLMGHARTHPYATAMAATAAAGAGALLWKRRGGMAGGTAHQPNISAMAI